MDTTPLPSDFSEFLKLLNKNDVRYLLVGGHAVGYYGHVRGTAGMDIWVDGTGENPDRVLAALTEFGFSGPHATADLFRKPGRIIREWVSRPSELRCSPQCPVSISPGAMTPENWWNGTT